MTEFPESAIDPVSLSSGAQSHSELLIVGASARACAGSAIRAGLTPCCIDQFADLDLRAQARVLRVENYPRDLPTLARQFPSLPWMYTGAIENYPDIITEIASTHPLLGNPPEVVHAARDPFLLAEWMHNAGLCMPEVCRSVDSHIDGGRWLRKPLRGGAGIGITTCEAALWVDNSCVDASSSLHYFQRFQAGESYSALFIGACGTARLLGVTRQLVGRPEFSAPPFAYCGSIGPVSISSTVDRQIRQIGEVLVERSGLRGLFGCDLIIDDGDVWLIEVNPRYPASAEVLERATGISTIAEHVRSCTDEQAPLACHLLRDAVDRSSASAKPASDRQQIYHGKAILYAEGKLEIPAHAFAKFREKEIADVPSGGDHIARGHPVCTVFASCESLSGCEQALFRRADEIRQQLEASIKI